MVNCLNAELIHQQNEVLEATANQNDQKFCVYALEATGKKHMITEYSNASLD